MKDKSRTKYTILGMLAIDSMTGYEITKMIQSSTHYFWSESEGQIYPALSQCVEEDFATCKEVNSKKIKRIKKIYSITVKGKRALTAWLKVAPQAPQVRNEFLLKLFFGGNIEDQDNINHIIQHKNKFELKLSSYLKLREDVSEKNKNSPHLKYWLITLDYGIKSVKAEIAWCNETLKILK